MVLTDHPILMVLNTAYLGKTLKIPNLQEGDIHLILILVSSHRESFAQPSLR